MLYNLSIKVKDNICVNCFYSCGYNGDIAIVLLVIAALYHIMKFGIQTERTFIC